MLDIIHKGIDWRQTLTVRDENDAPQDLTGLDVVIELRRRTSASNLLTLTPGNGITLQNQTTAPGVADVQLEAVDSVSLETASHVIRVLVEDQVAMDWVKVPVRD